MKTVSVDELKRNLSSFIDEATAGERFLITKHRRPVASLTAAGAEHLRIGTRFGRGRLRRSASPSEAGRPIAEA